MLLSHYLSIYSQKQPGAVCSQALFQLCKKIVITKMGPVGLSFTLLETFTTKTLCLNPECWLHKVTMSLQKGCCLWASRGSEK